MEKRNFTRIIFQSEAVVRYNDEIIEGDIGNLSLRGMLFLTSHELPAGSLITIKILLSGSSSELSVNLRGRVVRCFQGTLAVEFQEMDLDSFIHLKNIILYNTGDDQEVEEEFHRYLQSKPA